MGRDPVLVQTLVRHGRLVLWAFGLSMAGSLLTAMVAFGAVGAVGHSKGRSAAEEPRSGLTRRSQRLTRCLVCVNEDRGLQFMQPRSILRPAGPGASHITGVFKMHVPERTA